MVSDGAIRVTHIVIKMTLERFFVDHKNTIN